MGGDRTALETAVEWLRPLVNNAAWDYCIIWKLGDDPSKFIEWGACCCSGGNIIGNVKTEDENEGSVKEQCKDENNKHPVRSKACQVLAQLPSSIPLYSGIHGDVLMSYQTRWIVNEDVFASDSEPNGTQVLIPVHCGLVELFCFKPVPKDQNIIDYISARFMTSLDQENMNEKVSPNVNIGEQISNLNSSNKLGHFTPLIHCFNFLPQLCLPSNESSSKVSSICSSLSNEHQSLKINPPNHLFGYLGHMLQEKSKEEFIDSPSSNLRSGRKKNTDISLACGIDMVRLKKVHHKPDKGPYKSKNLLTERNRRRRIKDGMFTLRALVPRISKMDRASTLSDAAAYIEELQETIEKYHSELVAMQDEDCKMLSHVKEDGPNLSKANDGRKAQSNTSGKISTEVQVEISQIGTKDFLLKLICRQKLGGFSRLVEAMDSLGLLVMDANVTTLNESVLNILRVQANSTEVEPKTLKKSLIQLVK